jgi:antibiotic biosynthesis monooxygenase (ABM) superfamily enzyme
MQPITVIVARRPVSGKEREMETFTSNVKNVVSQFPGHLETVICKPSNKNDPEYRIVIKFDTLKNYQHWEQSAEREQLAIKGNAITDETPQLKIMTGLESWFSLPGNSPVKPPAKYKMVVVIWLCLFPLASLFNWLLSPYIYSWPQIGKTFIMTLIIVPIMTYIAMPIMRKTFTKWLYPDIEER